MGNKQEELQVCTRLQGYNIIGITEMRWDGSHDCNVGIVWYKPFRKGWQRRGAGVALWVNNQLESMELHSTWG